MLQKLIQGKAVEILAAELKFPGREQNPCFQFLPAQAVELTEVGMRFSIGTLNNDQWTVGACPLDDLVQWSWLQ